MDLAVVGAGAAGIFAALAASGALAPDGSFDPTRAAGLRIVLLDGQERPGKKILISGGGRCNVTNADVAPADYPRAKRGLVAAMLRAFPVASVRAFFAGRGVPLVEEPMGKLFPVTGKARSVLEALHGAVADAGIATRFGSIVETIERSGDGWRVDDLEARRVIVATGGKSVPETGSRGFGYALAERLGIDLEPTVPALVPLLGDVPEQLAGITVPVTLTVRCTDPPVRRTVAGSMLFTHRGISGPAALDASVSVTRALALGGTPIVRADFWTLSDRRGVWGPYLELPKPPGAGLRDSPPPAREEDALTWLKEQRERNPRRSLGRSLSARLPRRLVGVLAPDAEAQLAQLSDAGLRRTAQALTGYDLGVTGSEGFRKAEVTAGGIPTKALDGGTLEPRDVRGLHVCGEVVDVTGRLGGFNFQWAWSSGFVAGRAAREALSRPTRGSTPTPRRSH